MNFFIDHFWKILLFLAIAFGADHFYKKHQKEKLWESTSDSFARLADALHQTPPSSAKLAAWEADYWRLILKADEVYEHIDQGRILRPGSSAFGKEAAKEVEGVLRTFIKSAAEDSSYAVDESQKGSKGRPGSAEATTLLSETLVENHRLMSDLGIWGSEEALTALSRGESPVVASGPFAGEPLVLVRRISPSMYREGVTEPCNIIVLPKSAAATYFPEADEGMDLFAGRLTSSKLMNEQTRTALRAIATETAKR
jgi:hypothetical protein